MILGVTGKRVRGLPKCIEQVDVTKTEDLAWTSGTLKVEELVGDAKAPEIISMSLYDTNTVYIISVAFEEIKLLKKDRKLFYKLNRRWLLYRSIQST